MLRSTRAPGTRRGTLLPSPPAVIAAAAIRMCDHKQSVRELPGTQLWWGLLLISRVRSGTLSITTAGCCGSPGGATQQ